MNQTIWYGMSIRVDRRDIMRLFHWSTPQFVTLNASHDGLNFDVVGTAPFDVGGVRAWEVHKGLPLPQVSMLEAINWSGPKLCVPREPRKSNNPAPTENYWREWQEQETR